LPAKNIDAGRPSKEKEEHGISIKKRTMNNTDKRQGRIAYLRWKWNTTGSKKGGRPEPAWRKKTRGEGEKDSLPDERLSAGRSRQS